MEKFPTAGDGKIYTMNHNGTVLVISSKTGEILNQAEMGGMMTILALP